MKISHTLRIKALLLCLSISVHAYLTIENKVQNCESDEFFDSTALSCQKCPSTDTNKLVPTTDCKKPQLI